MGGNQVAKTIWFDRWLLFYQTGECALSSIMLIFQNGNILLECTFWNRCVRIGPENISKCL